MAMARRRPGVYPAQRGQHRVRGVLDRGRQIVRRRAWRQYGYSRPRGPVRYVQRTKRVAKTGGALGGRGGDDTRAVNPLRLGWGSYAWSDAWPCWGLRDSILVNEEPSKRRGTIPLDWRRVALSSASCPMRTASMTASGSLISALHAEQQEFGLSVVPGQNMCSSPE